MSDPVIIEGRQPGRSVTQPLARLWRVWGAKGSLTVLDQVLFGGANFLVGIALARVLIPRDYGAYALAYESFLLVAMVFGSMVFEPMLVFGPSVYRDRLREYLGTILRFHLLLAVAGGLVLGAVAWVAFRLSKDTVLPWALVGAAIAVPCVLLFWLARRACYVTLSPRRAVPGSLVYAVVLLGATFACYVLHLLTPFIALVLMSVSGVAAGLLLFRHLRPSLRMGSAHPRLPEVAGRHWGYGRWALAGAGGSWFCGSIYYVVLGGTRGLADTGSLKALLNFSHPIGQVFAAVSLLTIPYVATFFRDHGLNGIERLCWRFVVIYAGGALIYWIIVIVFRVQIVSLLYAGRYLGVAYLIPWMALGSVLRVSTVSQIVVLKAIQVPFLTFVAYGASSLAVLALGFPAIWLYGLEGAVFAYVISGATSVTMGFVLLRRHVRSRIRDSQCMARNPAETAAREAVASGTGS